MMIGILRSKCTQERRSKVLKYIDIPATLRLALSNFAAQSAQPCLIRASLICSLFLLVTASETLASVRIRELRSWQAPDHTRLVFELSQQTEHSMHILTDPDRLVLDIAEAGLPNVQVISSVNLKQPVTGIRHGQHGKKLRLVVDLKHKVHARSFLLEPNNKYGFRLVVDMYGEEKKKPKVSQPVQQNRDVIVVLDPGHGGEDPGAVGVTGLKEKDVTLRFSTMLRDQINRLPGVRSELTREKDYFIDLRKRSEIAREKNADLFLSVHANSFPDSRKVKGFMLFALSNKGATSEMARWLAKSENKSDEIGGTDSLALRGKNKNLRKVLIDLSMTSVLNHSIFAGKEILRSVDRSFSLHSKAVEQAAFTVLRSPDIPSLLLELGFLSNREEERQLTNKKYLADMAKSIATGVGKYLHTFPPFGTAIANKVDPPNIHQVVAGDTLSQIAERYKLSTGQLRKLNNLSDDTIVIGQRLKLYTDPQPETSEQKISEQTVSNQEYYLVKRGDTLSEIALRFSVPMSQLQQLNKLNGSGTIHFGQKIWLYQKP